jgi:hypothetical protein
LAARAFAQVSSFMHMSMVMGLAVELAASAVVEVHSPGRRGNFCWEKAEAVVMRANKASVANLGKVI